MAMTTNIESKVIKDAGLKVTRPRLSILELLQGSDNRHYTAEHVFRLLTERGEDIGLATVYRVLTQFEAAGIVERHHFEEGHAVFELQQERHHDHLVCIACGKVKEFYDPDIEKRQRRIAEEMGFQLVDHSHVIYGYCDDIACRNKNS